MCLHRSNRRQQLTLVFPTKLESQKRGASSQAVMIASSNEVDTNSNIIVIDVTTNNDVIVKNDVITTDVITNDVTDVITNNDIIINNKVAINSDVNT